MHQVIRQGFANLPLKHRQMMLLTALLAGMLALWPGTPKPSHSVQLRESHLLQHAVFWQNATALPLPPLAIPSPLLPAEDDIVSGAEPASYTVAPGDSLSSIFSRHGFSQQQMRQIMAADQSLLALDILRPGYQLTFVLDTEQQLQQMQLYIHAGNRVIYQRDENGEFSYQELLDEGEWQSSTLAGSINGSFYQSARQAGLTEADILTVQQLFRQRINFSRDIRAGDRFEVVRSDNFVGTEATGQSRIDGVRLFNRRQQHSAFLHDNGQYYAANGDSLERSFMRIPLAQQYRITDAFNPRRLHPVTGKVRPHNGTDFATPVGTAVLAAAEGTVLRVEKHPFAGRYIEIQHQGQYKSRYLHLNKTLVRPGQRVSKGQRIALSGASGRVTGAHLHYELHINNRPVNPMTADIPLAEPIPPQSRQAFLQRVNFMLAQMEQQTQPVLQAP
ncbi:MAG: peptidoglycan DD-metalloendopeptidase family protein [Gammaproteobacteria bacterium]|nr:peptidoglycan DD-metalloendopeptidase family protein [Gammaproteobacteria bacterium]MBU1554112.1 peptidoglycan DD-metalloendopeptidase family protein [Gammaproteobacteria bacterium]MBU2072212.1 peptidoglycan DD-metalloendopeptidase family protein [Gammaproteobacteria bacterium]MBU2182074.1 peptidoglycan DD-metalloendopeptidase family protein [Gammaproteobacteria bacterium]MBU2203917.1 peptidoglycan DD-metalloendopeptidase family protein [Gammaproteobacteria bacterium]